MVVANMDGPTRDQVLKLMDEKNKIEDEIKTLQEILERNNVDLTGDLVDQLGYPRSDIDVYQVRHARHRIICLQNDHKAMMKQIERGLHVLHARTLGTADESTENFQSDAGPLQATNGHASTSELMRVADNSRQITSGISVSNSGILKPIAKVDLVSPGSPAESAGLMLDDEILEFGTITSRNFTNLMQIGELVQHSATGSVQVKIVRGPQKNIVDITLLPRRWSGPGLIGCKIVPV